MATQSPKDQNAKIKKTPVAAFARISDSLKKATLASKLTAEELDKLGALAASLKVFVSN